MNREVEDVVGCSIILKPSGYDIGFAVLRFGYLLQRLGK